MCLVRSGERGRREQKTPACVCVPFSARRLCGVVVAGRAVHGAGLAGGCGSDVGKGNRNFKSEVLVVFIGVVPKGSRVMSSTSHPNSCVGGPRLFGVVVGGAAARCCCCCCCCFPCRSVTNERMPVVLTAVVLVFCRSWQHQAGLRASRPAKGVEVAPCTSSSAVAGCRTKNGVAQTAWL